MPEHEQPWAKEPWECFEYTFTNADDNVTFSGQGIRDSNGEDVHVVIEDTEGLLTKEDTARIIACVNACAGVPTETLVKGHTYKELLEHDSHFV